MRELCITAVWLALAWIFLVPEPLGAWGPATHVALGEALLNSLYLLPPALSALLESHPIQFLYGSVAADISFAKKYVPEGRHSHNWKVGEAILEAAPTDALRAAGYGYLGHLAADTLAHNTFVPRKLFLTRTGKPHGHTYWEHRVDLHVGEEFLGKARRLVMNFDHAEADDLFDMVLSRTIFSFRTNRRIFRGMIKAQDNDQWKQVFDRVLRSSRYDLPDGRVKEYMGFSFDFMVEYLRIGAESRPRALDPVGALNLRIAKKLRRAGIAEGGSQDPRILDALADRFFPLPQGPLLYWPKAKMSGKGHLLSPGSQK
ncbi:MAG: zinc dependent phospholipase C family protein [Longimicrobiales bacterium]|nr:zinc dependent phospholipase C family protein [Longimicrobiales bacterium]